MGASAIVNWGRTIVSISAGRDSVLFATSQVGHLASAQVNVRLSFWTNAYFLPKI